MFSEILFFKLWLLNSLKSVLENKNFTDAIENSFLRMVETFLKRPSQKIICAICRG